MGGDLPPPHHRYRRAGRRGYCRDTPCRSSTLTPPSQLGGGEWPRVSRATHQRDEIAPLHSITSSARASTEAGTSSPSALALLRLITSSYLVGACTGKSAGFSPLRMRST